MRTIRTWTRGVTLGAEQVAGELRRDSINPRCCPSGRASRLWLGARARASRGRHLSVDATKVPEKTVDKLAVEAYPVQLKILPEETLRAAVERQCVRATPFWYSLLRSQFFELNPKLSVAADTDILDAQIINASTFRGPFCFRLPSGGTEPSRTATALARRHWYCQDRGSTRRSDRVGL